MKYRKKPIVVEAEQWFPGKEIPGVTSDYLMGNLHTTCTTIHGQVTHIALGDFVITEPDGIHHYPCKPDIFHATYEAVE